MFTRVFPIRSLLVCAVLIGVSAAVCLPLAAKTRAAFSADAWSDIDRGAIDQRVFELALGAAACAVKSGQIVNPSTLTIIDYSQPSTERRLWVFDLHRQALLYEELVAHGKESGDNMATRFSNEMNSHQSSLGLFLTEDTYVGRNGYSLRLRGLDEGFNDRAHERAIVMHGAPYVNDDIGRTMGRLGRSWGCPALREGVARAVIDRVKGTGILFAYYPDSEWLKSSKYLNDCQTSAHSTN
ncbi:MAG TPA: murein L,D-transpeptidase catalytic domain family protein [Vicinamibacterales bacterium]|nr:murein L,D-transpeptidase catalytic domain family protein [Vicinamibacterales bacterium]